METSNYARKPKLTNDKILKKILKDAQAAPKFRTDGKIDRSTQHRSTFQFLLSLDSIIYGLKY